MPSPDVAAFLATIERMATENARLAAALATAEERLRQLEGGAAGDDAAVAANQAPGRAEISDVGEDGAMPAASPWSRFWRWVRGAEASR
jgi:hypothetical protein